MSERKYTGFALFRNDPTNKRNPKSPDYAGKGTVDKEVLDYIVDEVSAGREPEFELVGWQKEGRSGKRFISLVLKKPFVPHRPVAQRLNTKPQEDMLGDDIPF